MLIKIALAGNPNSGKTTMFNDLTGSFQYVGNWPGVTVEKKEGRLKGNKDIVIQDLPGIYSLSPYTMEEVVSRNYLINEKPNAIINIVDASNIERNLYLTTQLAELGVPMIMALNMIDIVNKNGDIIDISKLGALLGIQVLETSALKGLGSKEVVDNAVAIVSNGAEFKPSHTFSSEVEAALSSIESLISGNLGNANARWYSIKLFERDKEVLSSGAVSGEALRQIEEIIKNCEAALDDDSESIITAERYLYIDKIIKQCVKKKNADRMTTSDKIDSIVTHRIFALPIFAIAMFMVYFISISTVGTWMTDWVNESLFGDIVPNAVNGFLVDIGTAEWLNSLIIDGILAGVGAVIGFLPQMLMLFLCLAILEDCGYMARIAFVLDRVFRNFGLSGKSFIPMLVSTGCGVPGIMASRTIENENDRRLTVMTTTFIPCGAKLPIIALISGALFPDSVWVAPSTYFLGIAAIIVSSVILKKTKLFAGNLSPFVMELPLYHLPGIKGVARTVYDRGFAFVKKAGTLVLLATVSVWFLSNFSLSLQMVETNGSILASLGNIIAPIFAPLGWGDWRASVATITGLLAKENVAGTLGVLFGYAEVAEDGADYWPQLIAAYTPLAAYSFLAFNLLCAPCFAAIGALRREMMSGKWTWFAVIFQCAFAYVVSLIIYQFGMLFGGHATGLGTIFAFACAAILLFLLFKKPYSDKQTA